MAAPPFAVASGRVVLFVMLGMQATGGYSIAVTRVTRSTGDGIHVEADEHVPGSPALVTEAETSPYEIIDVPAYRGTTTWSIHTD